MDRVFFCLCVCVIIAPKVYKFFFLLLFCVSIKLIFAQRNTGGFFLIIFFPLFFFLHLTNLRSFYRIFLIPHTVPVYSGISQRIDNFDILKLLSRVFDHQKHHKRSTKHRHDNVLYSYLYYD